DRSPDERSQEIERSEVRAGESGPRIARRGPPAVGAGDRSEVQGCIGSRENVMASEATMTSGVFESVGDSIRSYRSWVIAAGLTPLARGVAAIVYNGTATIASVTVFGVLLMFAGVVQIVHAFQVRTWSGFFLYLLDGIVRTVVGTLMVMYPQSGAQAITLLLSFYFIVA